VTIFDNFGIIFLGTIIVAFAQGFYINSSSKLASQWFGDKERALSTALGDLSMPIVCIVGFVLSSSLMGDDYSKDQILGKKHFSTLIFVQNILATVCSIPVLLLARDKPPTPPSLAATAH
jgi:sugar phosphate permease